MRIIDADTCVQAVDSATLNEDAGTLSNVHTIFQGTPFYQPSGEPDRFSHRHRSERRQPVRRSWRPLHRRSDPMQAQQTDKYLGKVIHINPGGKAGARQSVDGSDGSLGHGSSYAPGFDLRAGRTALGN